MFRWRLFAFLFAAAVILPWHPHAQNASDGTLHIVRPNIDAEQDAAELCLEFDHALDRTNPGRIAAGIHLESVGKTVPANLSNINLGPTSFCIQGLSHRQDYSLTVSDLRGAAGEKLTEPYRLSFTVPDRHPALAFAGDTEAGHFARIDEGDPVLRAINVARAKVTLYRISDPDQMAEAFRQRRLATLAPSESLYFAKTSTQPLWQDELVLSTDESKSANRNLEHTVPLHAALGDKLTFGLYLIVAQDAEPAPKIKGTDSLAPIAAQWFVHSDLAIRVLPRSDGFSVETEKADAMAVMKGAHLAVFGADNKSLTDVNSDASGLGFLSLAPDKMASAATIIGSTAAGDVDFIDVSMIDRSAPQNQYTLPGLESGLVFNRPFYFPSAEIYVTFTARNARGGVADTAGSSVQLLRPDHGLYATLPVPDGKAGVQDLSFPAPVLGGLWTAVWHGSDGRVLAQAPLRVTSNPDAPQLSVTSDRPMINNDGELNLSLAAVTNSSKPAFAIAGRIFVQWTTPDTFPNWADYHFGKEDNADQPSSPAAAFITDANGLAHVHVNLKPPDDNAPLHTVLVSVRSDPVAGAFDPDPIQLPIKPNNTIIGIKPLTSGGKFAENSLARFDVVAIDGDGKRRDEPGLKYQIYEEGRSFAWYQAEGRWDYKQLQQRRRSGGGAFDIRADGENTIRWPVTAGTYLLEITDTSGAVLARLHFDAGWSASKTDQPQPADLALKPDMESIEPGTSAHIKFKLDHPSIISAVIADDQIRKIIHEARPAGANEIAVTPEKDWGNQIRISVDAEQKTDGGTASFAGRTEIALRQQKKALAIAGDFPSRAASSQPLMLTLNVGNIEKKHPTFINVLATPVPDDKVLGLPVILVKDLATDADGKAVVHVAVPDFSGALQLTIFAANQDQEGRKTLSIPVEAAFTADLPLPEILNAGDTVHLTLGLKSNKAPAGSYRYALSADVGLKLSGSLEGKAVFTPGGTRTLAADILAGETGERMLKLDVAGPHGFHFSRAWTVSVVAHDNELTDVTGTQISPQQSWTSETKTGGKDRVKAKPEIAMAFVSPRPLFDAPQMLPALINAVPATTVEISSWLATVQLWHEPIVRAGLLPEAELKARQDEVLKRLIARQKPDGGFPALPEGASNLFNTSAALTALAHAGQAWAHPAIDAAVGWLQQKLANTWFDESERPDRAAAFAALAAADRIDVASLRYFAETSAGKNLPPLADAQLAVALAKINDKDKATTALKSIRDQMASAPALWPMLAENPVFNPDDLLPVLQKASADFAQHTSTDAEKIASFLCAVAVIANRTGNWHASINGEDRNRTGIAAITPVAKSGSIVVHNLMDQPLYLATSGKPKTASANAANAGVAFHIYQLDGKERDARDLKEGEIYIVALEGPAPDEENPSLFFHDDTNPALRPLSCTLDTRTDLQETWGWLKNPSLTPISACEAGAGGIDAVLEPSASDAKTAWRAAYLAQAVYIGSFRLAPATIRADGGDWQMTGNPPSVVIK